MELLVFREILRHGVVRLARGVTSIEWRRSPGVVPCETI